ncbi:ArsR/SmtB family transcription factor [Bailinhaonella thermotolerans]|uniref:Transcriptional regulator n=1 Tax=Bailinhaonella thermotolerans TaxID=1070861 RepID=A0A3A4AVD1_9ACTN|nr:metalloregulator ArsR/SmtB family transcription factor [Bailinhaonella thermotolerans]RJL32671.1 transcriptional regulator [Bailinhaonella thermotolerans]
MHRIPADRLDSRIIAPEEVCEAIGALAEDSQVRRAAEIFGLLADPNRLRLLLCLRAVPGMCVSDLAAATGMADSAVSHALRLLRAQSVVRADREGRLVKYAISDKTIEDLLSRTVDHPL